MTGRAESCLTTKYSALFMSFFLQGSLLHSVADIKSRFSALHNGQTFALSNFTPLLLLLCNIPVKFDRKATSLGILARGTRGKTVLSPFRKHREWLHR